MNEFDLILEECVDLIASGETSPEECLDLYPEYAAQLEPILNTTVRLQEEGREVTPPPFLRARIRGELNRAMKSNPQKKSRPLFFLANGPECLCVGVCPVDDQYGFRTGSPAWGNTLQLETGQREPLAGSYCGPIGDRP
jgi:hypothetical protein